MSASRHDNLIKARNVAQWITVVAAVLSGVVWIVTGFSDSNAVATIASVLVAVTALGGVAMGLLYAVTKRSD
jgi:uncharacterized membrane-anchored protein